MKLFNFFKKVIEEFGEDKAGTLSAAFAYTAVFAIGPLLLVLISVVGFIFGKKAASGQLFSQISDVVGPDAARSIQNVIANIHQSGSNILAFVIGIVGTLLVASGISSQLQNSFDIIFDAVPDPDVGIRRTIYSRLKNIFIILSAGVVIVASVIFSAIVSGLSAKLDKQVKLPSFGLEALNTLIALIIISGFLYLIYKTLPNVKIPKKIVFVAAAVVGVMFVIGKTVLGFIIGKNATAGAYGVAASVIVLLLWFYYVAQILLLGAEGIKVYGDNHTLVYKAKKYTLKRKSMSIDLEDNLLDRYVEAFIQGFKKSSRRNRGK